VAAVKPVQATLCDEVWSELAAAGQVPTGALLPAPLAPFTSAALGLPAATVTMHLTFSVATLWKVIVTLPSAEFGVTATVGSAVQPPAVADTMSVANNTIDKKLFIFGFWVQIGCI
jgi:hypothetical protein